MRTFGWERVVYRSASGADWRSEAPTRIWSRRELDGGESFVIVEGSAVIEPEEAFRETTGLNLLAVGPFAAASDSEYPDAEQSFDLLIDGEVAGLVHPLGVYWGSGDTDYLLLESEVALILPRTDPVASGQASISRSSETVDRDDSESIRLASIAVVERLAHAMLDAPSHDSEQAVAHSILGAIPVLVTRARIIDVNDPLGDSALRLLSALLGDLADWVTGSRLPRTRSALLRLLNAFGRPF